ncbi:PREDICTED: polyhomeotic-like protein 2 [Lepidothrix coronata]|uniref:Polyhomeotic-like protein 2 n=1 Tax=Lepidothrix coronata TaxID=321398 RepID=A0A6J0JA63_9PASS|nr:PREDICTED: polyhomeotic-like protein 2 [Lepidothrix coronata]
MTSGSGSAAATVAGAAPHNGENKPPQAIVKPQILTHVIEGFVIQEGAEPFPVGRSSLLVGALHKQYAQELLPDKLPPQDNTTTTDSDMEEPYLQESKEEGNPPKLKCELCGRVDFAYKFKRSKRFCSMACAKRSLPAFPGSAGCQEIAEEFRAQEIDGQALLLLKEDHLMSTMNIKLGPALKIYARINMLKDS